MPLQGNPLATAFSTINKQTITGNGTVGPYTLDYAAGSDQDVEVFVNNVRQEPGVAYTVAGTSMTMTGVVQSSDDFYVVFQGKAQQSVTHPSNSALAATTGTFSGDLTVDTNTLYVDSTNNRVGIGTTTPSGLLSLESNNPNIRFDDSDTSNNGEITLDNTALRIESDEDNAVANSLITFRVDGSEGMRIDSGGNLLVGTTTSGGTIGTYDGFGALSGGTFFSSATSNRSIFARRSTDGGIVAFRKDGTNVGSIGTNSGDLTIDGAASHSGLRFLTTYIQPRLNGSASNGGVDLGAGAARFDDIFAVNATIQTSDANEKQQIATLTDAEMTAAKAISQLFKTFKWNSAVTEKGDAARTHAGVIAQDVQAAMTDAGLDAGDYAFFISTTWWETQTDVPAVEAADAVLDDDGNVVTEAVEAVDAYTRTDTYDTAEEAPEGATERTRLGIRYPELLAFVSAATEQRLANIETRLTALENA